MPLVCSVEGVIMRDVVHQPARVSVVREKGSEAREGKDKAARKVGRIVFCVSSVNLSS